MAQNFGSTSTQGSMLVSVSGSAGDEIVLKDSSGTTLVSYQPEKSFTSVVISSPQIKEGETYTLSVGDDETEITMTDLIYGSNGSMGGFGGGMGGSFGGGQGGGKQEKPSGEMPNGDQMELPDGETPTAPPTGDGETV
jgi:hypothetical protein